MNVSPILVAAIGGALAYGLARKKKKRRRTAAADEPIIEEVVPAPSESSSIVSSGALTSPQFGDVNWWIAAYGDGFGWQYATADGNSEISYKDGLIYHYPTADAAMADLMEVIG